jgi:pimeloyl-ACP methyl ester carboxylesterase
MTSDRPPAPSPPSSARRRFAARRVALFVLVVVTVLLVRPVGAHLRAASLLVRFSDPAATGTLADLARHPVSETSLMVPAHGEPTRARLYTPTGVAHPPGIVLLHGVHNKGIEEPRLIRFAQTIAATGIAVLTPELREIADYRIDPVTLETIAGAARTLRDRLGGEHGVGVMGLSFSGGLALVAASDPRFNADITYVVAVGAHDDLPRVLRFFATDAIDKPDGSHETMHAHDYGPLVLVYSSIEDFFPADDVPIARDALRLWLGEQFDDAREKAEGLSPASAERMRTLFDHKVASLAPELLAEIEKRRDEMRAVSPHDHMKDVKVPVYLLHGAGDSVIPASETLWLEADAPRGIVRATLVSAAIEHVELHGEPSAGDKWALVHFMSGVLAEADRLR